MTDQQDYTFPLNPNSKIRHIVGEFDIKTRKPHYEIEIKSQPYIKNQVEVTQIMVGTPENCQWAYDIHNKSSWPIFVILKKDGEVLKIT
jgi:hypothetical protein